ncbi:TANFOR domain-containing protein [Mucilaginibacter sp. SG538B]|uniref:carboxypeptidase-like regulatory domain-containing protein n=1 Tax=Mucilaginibacter sp. SG538B TaxID=2587021 RepID=UPI00159E5956|nr:carboxypeptidase-like regulatory domain-containing protein [Mucilaginibacter sp. SG538B]NVM67768.1 TANFOR domain-containing protein [Mucilaginibacter sp. SG538B]
MKKLYLFLLICIAWLPLKAQVSVSIQILPPYPRKITDYASQPQLMVIAVTNVSTKRQRIQLRGTITGDNGVILAVKPNYKSPVAIELDPGQTRSLNGNDLSKFFDYTQVKYTGITQSEFINKNGLPEGSYRFCLQAFDYDTNAVISPDEPVGCSNTFTISSLEPPTIISPIEDAQLSATGGQIVLMQWTTPPGTSPQIMSSVRYKLRMVEVLGDRNPSNALMSATQPYFFEKEVVGNSYVYNAADPQLTPGRRYALLVEAFDPFNNTPFRNKGRSEVRSFIYGGAPIVKVDTNLVKEQAKQKAQSVQYATNTIKGKLVWTFKKTEAQYTGSAGFGGVSADIPAPINTIVKATPPPIVLTGAPIPGLASRPISSILKTSVFNAPNVLNDSRIAAAAQVDPTLIPYVPVQTTAGLGAGAVMTTTGGTNLSYNEDAIAVDSATERYALPNADIVIKGVVDPNWKTDNGFSTTTASTQATNYTSDFSYLGMYSFPASSFVNPMFDFSFGFHYNLDPPPVEELIATSKTDGGGNFAIDFTHPSYMGLAKYTKLIISITSENFEQKTVEIPISKLDSTGMRDIGQILLLARTLRYTPKLTLDDVADASPEDKIAVVHIYRNKIDFENDPYLYQEGNIPFESKHAVTINGRSVVEVSVDSVKMGTGGGTLKYGKLFYGGRFLVVIESHNQRFNGKTTDLEAHNLNLASNLVLNVKADYRLTATPAYVFGEVRMSLPTGFVPVTGAIVKIEYNTSDLLNPGPPPFTGSIIDYFNRQASRTAILLGGNNNQMPVVSGVIARPLIINTPSLGGAQFNGPATIRPMPAIAGLPTAPSPISNTVVSNANKSTILAESVLSKIDELNLVKVLTADYGPYSAKTDSLGRFTIPNLPQLKDRASFKVKLIKVSSEFQDLEVTPDTVQTFQALANGSNKEVIFSIKPDIVSVVGRAISSTKQAIANARLHFVNSTVYFNSGEDGLFQTSYYQGNHKLMIEKEGYISQTIDVVIPAPPKANANPAPGNGLVLQNPSNVISTVNRVINPVINPGDNIAKLNQLNANILTANSIQASINRGFVYNTRMFGFAGPTVASATSPAIGDVKLITNAIVLDNSTPKIASPIGNMVGNNPVLTGPVTDQAFINSPAMRASAILFADLYSKNLHNNPLVQSAVRTIDLGDCGNLVRRTGRIRFRILDPNGALVNNATITLFDTSHVATNGEWYYEGFGGNAKVSVTPPGGSGLVAVENTVIVQENGIEGPQNITLAKGTLVSGVVTAAGSNLGGAVVEVEGQPYLNTVTGVDGRYQISLPAGKTFLKASKSGFISLTQEENLTSEPASVNFTLGDGGGKNISKLLGFPVALDQMTPDGLNSYRVTGKFSDLTPLFSVLSSHDKISLKFTNIKVTFDASNNPIPEGNKVQTDDTQLSLKLFNFLPLILKPDGETLVVTGTTGGKGEIKGKLQLDMTGVTDSRGYLLAKSYIPQLIPDNTSSPEVPVFSSGGVPSALTKLKFTGGDTGMTDWEAEVYGFKAKIAFAGSYVDQQGIHMQGSVSTPDLGVIKTINLKIEDFVLNPQLQINKLKIVATDLPKLSIGSWEASLASLVFTEDGFNFGGSITVQIPKSTPSTVSFSDLRVGKDIFYGGSFKIPDEGLNLLNVVKLMPGSTPLSFGKAPGSSAYKLAGSGKIKFDTFITKEINLPVFEIQTDGRFLIDAPTDFSADFAFAKFKVQSIQFNTTDQIPFIGVQGEFTVDVPMIKFTAGDIRFKAKVGGGIEASVSKLGATIDIPVMKSEIEVGIKDNGFDGAGSLSIPGTPINASVNFHYYKVTGGIDVGAAFSAGTVIPVGIITIDHVGGGFNYNSAEKKFKIDINGGLSFTGTSTLVKLDPIGLTVESGPVIKGYATVQVADYLNLAHADLVLDIPNQYFTVGIISDIEPIKGLVKAHIQGDLVVSGKSTDKYVFLGCGMDLSLLGLINARADYAMAIGLKNPRTRTDRLSYYFANAAPEYINTEFSGIYLNSTASLGIPENRAIGFDVYVASASVWFYTESKSTLLLNFAENSYLLGLSGKYGGGAKACAIGLCVSAGFQACYDIRGGRNDTDGWFISGSAGGRADFSIGGCSPGCNSIDTCWDWPPAGAKVCATANVDLGYAQHRGLNFGIHVGGDRSVCP